MKKYIFALLTAALLLTTSYAQDADSLKIKPVTLGVLLQANFAGEHMYIDKSDFDGAGIAAYPGFGVELGGFIDYHITRKIAVEVQVIAGLQNGRYVATDKDLGFIFWQKRPSTYLADVRLVGLDIPIYFVYSLPVGEGHFNFGAGLFTHITFDAWSPGDRNFVTPYNRVISKDDVTGKTKYALSDGHAGLGFQIGYEFAPGLQINLSGKYSVIDIINYESKASHAHPYTLSMGLGWHF